MVRVRFAPSPTGFLHIGSARTALFNWLFARHMGGIFVFRVEDTDKERSKDEFLREIISSLEWMGMNWDEGPFYQTKRLDVYREYAGKLLKGGKAYEAEGTLGGEKAVILTMPKVTMTMDDIVHGPVSFDMNLQKDLVLMKSDGFPAYNFACVIDDYDMKITHVIRGDDHISNTPKQLAVYQALGIEPPKFAHIPLILGTDRSRMSKRHGATSISDYREMGFLPDALVNYISLLGWAPTGDREVMPIGEIIREFSLERVGKTGSVFDIDKLIWMNGEYLRAKKTEDLVALAVPGLKEKGVIKDGYDKALLTEVIKLFHPRAKTIVELIDSAAPFFKDEVAYDEAAVASVLAKEGIRPRLEAVIAKFSPLKVFDPQTLEVCVRDLASESGVKAAELIHPIRVAVTGRKVGASLFETISLIGKEKTLARLKAGLGKTLSILAAAGFLMACRDLYAEKIFYKNGTSATEQVIGRDKNSVWLKDPSGDITINPDRIEKILNDDGSISKYDYGTILKTIEEKVKAGSYGEAADLCDLLVQSFPKSNEVHYLRAVLNQKAGRLSKTTEDYKFIIDSKDGDAKVFNNLGAIYAADKNNQLAMEMFKKAAEKNGDIPEVHYNLAFLFLQAKDYDSAIDEYNKVIAKEPDSTTALYNLGVAYAFKGDYAGARDRFQKVLAIDKGDQSAKKALKGLSEKK
ncbi:MAG: glutamate--tRNA ligase [Candidatus Omnitrophica bacterium]|nr:glutamate--tRNA ligase [Candidatus Omnitrophota bacterium]